LNDIYPGEMANAIRIVKESCVDYPSSLEWTQGYPIVFDFAMGVSWGRVLEFDNLQISDNKVQITLSGGNHDWELVKKELELGYDDMFCVKDIREGRELTPDNDFILHNTKSVKVDLELAYL
jgi:hypothetical protein